MIGKTLNTHTGVFFIGVQTSILWRFFLGIYKSLIKVDKVNNRDKHLYSNAFKNILFKLKYLFTKLHSFSKLLKILIFQLIYVCFGFKDKSSSLFVFFIIQIKNAYEISTKSTKKNDDGCIIVFSIYILI